MTNERLAGETTLFGHPSGLTLSIKSSVRRFLLGGVTAKRRVNVTAWRPSPEELEKLAAGHLCYVSTSLNYEMGHPIWVEVGEVPE